jgi:acetyl-CoA acetyltransferase
LPHSKIGDEQKRTNDFKNMPLRLRLLHLWKTCGSFAVITQLSTEATGPRQRDPKNSKCGKPGTFSLALPTTGLVALGHPVFSTGSGK